MLATPAGRKGLSFEELIHPVDREEFLERYWEQEYLHLSRGEPDFYREVFSLEDVDRWIAASSRTTGNTVSLRSSDGYFERWTPETVSLEAVYEGVAQGKTLILRHIEESWPPLQPIVASLEEALSSPIMVNLYLSPEDSRGFPRHIDYHDFFIFQLHGAKDWFLFERTYLPMERLEHGPYPELLEGTTGETPPRKTLRLEQGDLLYVPRGMPHYALAAEGPSLHLTVSFHPLYWMDLLKAAVEEVSVRNECFQKALPPGFLADPERRQGMEDAFVACLESFREEASFRPALEALMERQIRKPHRHADGHVAQVLRLDEIAVDTEVERRCGMLCSVEPQGDQVVIRYGAGELRGPAAIGPALEFVRDHRRFRASDLPGLSDQAGVTLVRRLIRGGLLREVSKPRE